MEVLRFVVLGVAQNDHDIAAKIEGLRDADPKIRGHSAEILGDLHSAEAVPALVSILLNDTHAHPFVLAIPVS